MSATNGDPISAFFGMNGQSGADRAVAEFFARRPVLIASGDKRLLALPVEGLDSQRLAEFAALCAPVAARVVVTARRAQAIGLKATTPVALDLGADPDVAMILRLVADAKTSHPAGASAAGPLASAAIELAKLSQGLPAVLVADVVAGRTLDHRIVTVGAEAIGRLLDDIIESLVIASKAAVPLNSGTRADFVVFRDAMGASQVAIIVGKPDFSEPVLVRLHSACLTGDVFGSRRCDCGDQLNLALKNLEQIGGGVVLYLPQEGRGLGLANKMRTYQMQDDGLDTVDANTTLGFDDDERDYRVAARMLQMLGCHRVVLLTNNPTKLDGLAKSGIKITGRMAIEAPVNADNRRYLTAKAARAGHRLDHLANSLTEPSDIERDVTTLAP